MIALEHCRLCQIESADKNLTSL